MPLRSRRQSAHALDPYAPISEYRMKQTSSKAARNLLMDDFRRVIADAEALIEASASDGSADLAQIRERAEASLTEMKSRLGDVQKNLKDSGEQAVGVTQDYISNNPWTAVGIAAGAGLLLGLLGGKR
ncbi:MAG: YqjD family protein [Gammaproteobacteria bacterium]